MNVVIVGPFGMRPRSTMRIRALPVAKTLAARGYEVTMLLPPWQNPEDAGRRWQEGGVRVENVPLPPRFPGVFQGILTLNLARRALALQPDVVYLFKPKAYSGLTHWLLARLPQGRRPRLVVDADDWEGPGGWNELGEYTWRERRFFAWQERWGLTHADAVTVASRTLETLVWSLGLAPHRVFYVPNGVEDDPITRERLAPRDGRGEGDTGRQRSSRILLYTRFFEFSVRRVIEVFGYVRERVPDAHLLVVGEGLFGEEEELFRLADQAGLRVERPGFHGSADRSGPSPAICGSSGDITYVGWVDGEALASYFGRASVAIYPFDDTLVNRAKCAVKLRDLLAAGVPVVADAVGQNREYIRDGETGLLVDPGDVAGFGAAVVRLLTTPDLADRVGEAAAGDLRQRFAWEELVGLVEEAFRVRA